MPGDFLAGCFTKSIAVLIISFVISFLLAPVLWAHSTRKGFTAIPNHRSSHDQFVPNTGGILLFFSITIPVVLFANIRITPSFIFILIAFFSLFGVGIMDDLKNVSVKFKLLGQFIPAIFIILSLYNQDLVIPFFQHSSSWPFFPKFIFWTIAVVAIINAYNFIDGIDGLAIGLGLLSGLLFGYYFYLSGNCNLSLLAFSFSGGLGGLLKHNISSKRKIFIGDTGSLIIGGVLSLFILRHLEINYDGNLNFSSSMIFGTVFIPIADLVRIVFVRLVNRKSPFTADRKHVHHILMDSFSMSHRRTSAVLIAIQGLVFLIFLGFNELFQKGQIIFSLSFFLLYVLIVYRISLHRVPISS